MCMSWLFRFRSASWFELFALNPMKIISYVLPAFPSAVHTSPLSMKNVLGVQMSALLPELFVYEDHPGFGWERAFFLQKSSHLVSNMPTFLHMVPSKVLCHIQWCHILEGRGKKRPKAFFFSFTGYWIASRSLPSQATVGYLLILIWFCVCSHILRRKRTIFQVTSCRLVSSD